MPNSICVLVDRICTKGLYGGDIEFLNALKLVEVLGHVDHDDLNSMDMRVERGTLCKVRGPNDLKKEKKMGLFISSWLIQCLAFEIF